LYRDEYFEQCMTQTRRFGEQICKEMFLEENREPSSFDEMLATLKDQSHGYAQEKEFIDDLYFLKKNGNQSVHSGKVKKDAMTALECLKRSFEIAINYSVYNKGASSNILKLNYDVELLITNKKSKPSLQEKYEEAKEKKIKEDKKLNNKIVSSPLKQKQSTKEPKIQKVKETRTNIRIPIFWKFICVLLSISILCILFLVIGVWVKSL